MFSNIFFFVVQIITGIKVQPSDAKGRWNKNLHKQNLFMKLLNKLHSMFLWDPSNNKQEPEWAIDLRDNHPQQMHSTEIRIMPSFFWEMRKKFKAIIKLERITFPLAVFSTQRANIALLRLTFKISCNASLKLYFLAICNYSFSAVISEV